MSPEKLVAATMAAHDMLGRGRRVGVAVSGGADSVFLLHILSRCGLAAAVLHVNHKLRGDESDSDEVFVAELASAFELPFHAVACPVPTGNLEQEARRARYEFFRGHIASGICDSVATGHTLDDQAETVLSRFLRGAGTAGLSGILPVTREGIVRPLLAVRRRDVRSWLEERNAGWREDCTNSATEFQRNRLRMDIMPLLAELNPSLPEVLSSVAEWARGEELYWNSELDRLEGSSFDVGPETVLFRTAILLAHSGAVQRRLLRRAIERVRGSLRGIDFRHVEAIRIMAESREGSGRVQLPGLDIYRSFDWMRLAPPGFDSRRERDFEAPLTAPGVTHLPDRGLTIDLELVTAAPVYNSQMDVLDWDRCEGDLTVRNWRPGDSYRMARAPADERTPAPKKIKTLFQENRIPLWERRNWPVIVSGGSIVWSRRFGVGREFAPGPRSRRMLAIRESGESNYSLETSIETGGSFGRVDSVTQSAAPKQSRIPRQRSVMEERRLSAPGAEVL